MDRNSALDWCSRRTEYFKIQKICFDEFRRIKAKQESVYIIKRENNKVADAAYIKSNLAGISPKDIRESVKRKQKAGCELKQNQSPAAVVL